MANATTGTPNSTPANAGSTVPATPGATAGQGAGGAGKTGGSLSAGTGNPVNQPAKPVAKPAPAFTIYGLGEADQYLKLLVHGDYGTGKTRLVASAVLVPHMRDILFVDAESGDLTITTEALFKPLKDHFKVIKVRDFKTYARVQEYLKLHCQYRDMNNEVGDAKLKELEQILFPQDAYNPETPPRKFYTVITDSLSEVEAYSINQTLGITDKSRIDDETGNPEWAHYRQNHAQILRAIRAYRDLPMHVLFTSASAYTQDEQKRMIWSPALTGKLSRQCQGFMDIVGFMTTAIGENGTKVHNMQVQPTAKINAKCRFSNFKQVGWQDPTIKSILQSVGLMAPDALATGQPVKK